jgi:hypothetical protein
MPGMLYASIVGVRPLVHQCAARSFVRKLSLSRDSRKDVILDAARIYQYRLDPDTLPSAGYSPQRGGRFGRSEIIGSLRGMRSDRTLKQVLMAAKSPHGTWMSWQGELKQHSAACDQAKTARYGESALNQDCSAAVPRTSPVRQHASPVRCKSPRDHGVG